MPNFILASYLVSFFGLFLTSIYGTMDVLKRRENRFLLTTRRRTNPHRVHQSGTPPSRKFANIYRARKFRKMLMNEVNRINTKLRIRTPRQRYLLYHDADGEIRVRCK